MKRLLCVVAALAAALTACGIRPTSVPVDAGAAPSRVSCEAPQATASPTTGRTAIQVYLVCSAQVSAVRRLMPDGVARSRLETARLLLAELQSRAGTEETAAGFISDVPGDLDVSGPRKGDPADALRLSAEKDELPSFALAQIVCTFAGTAAGSTDRTVVLGFSGTAAARRFRCTSDLRTLPDAAQTAGTAVK